MLQFWAYLHSEDRRVHIKRLFQMGPVNDLEYAKSEMVNGNPNILDIYPCPIEAETQEKALQCAEDFFRSQGYSIVGYAAGKIDSPAVIPSPLDRFLLE